MVRKKEEFDQVESQQAEAFMRSQPSPRDFDHFGLRFDLAYLTALKYGIIHLPLEYMAAYADRPIYTAISNDNVTFVREWLEMIPKDLAQFNATSIGNLARIACYSKNDELRLMAREFLNELEKWYQDTLQATTI